MCGLFSDDCKPLIKFQGRSLGIATIKGPVKLPFEVGGVEIKPEVLQAASNIAQILDIRQYQNCQLWKEMRSIHVDNNKMLEILMKMKDDDEKLQELAILASANYSSADQLEKVLSSWIQSAYPQGQAAEKEIKVKTDRAPLSKIVNKAMKASPVLYKAMSEKMPFNLKSALSE